MTKRVLALGLVTVALVLIPGLAVGATTSQLAWEDSFERESGSLGSPWVDPGGIFRVDQGSGRAYAAGIGSAWRDVGAIDHEIEITPYKLTDAGSGNSIGGVTVGQVDANNFVAYELVKSTPDFLNGPEAKSVLYVRVAGQETELVTVSHPEFAIDQTVDLRLRKVGPVVEAYIDDVLDARVRLNGAQDKALSGTNVGLVNFTGPNNYYEARAFRLIVVKKNPGKPNQAT